MPASQGRDPVGLVLLCVAFFADPEVGGVHQANHRRQDLLPIKLFVPQVLARDAAHPGKVVREAQDPLELLALLALTIFRAVDVLEPSRRVVADGLNLGRRTAGYVNVAPGWRYLEILYALENLFLAYGLPGIRVPVK